MLNCGRIEPKLLSQRTHEVLMTTGTLVIHTSSLVILEGHYRMYGGTTETKACGQPTPTAVSAGTASRLVEARSPARKGGVVHGQ